MEATMHESDLYVSMCTVRNLNCLKKKLIELMNSAIIFTG